MKLITSILLMLLTVSQTNQAKDYTKGNSLNRLLALDLTKVPITGATTMAYSTFCTKALSQHQAADLEATSNNMKMVSGAFGLDP